MPAWPLPPSLLPCVHPRRGCSVVALRRSLQRRCNRPDESSWSKHPPGCTERGRHRCPPIRSTSRSPPRPPAQRAPTPSGAADRHGRADGVRRPGRRRHRRHHLRRQRARRRAARSLPRTRPGPVRRPGAGGRHRHRRALRRGVAARPGGRRLRGVRRSIGDVLDDAGEGVRADRPRRAGVPAGRLRAGHRLAQGRAAHRGGLPHRDRLRLARARLRGVHRVRAVLPSRLPDVPAARVDPGARGRAGEARARRDGRRPRLRARSLHAS